MMSRPLIAAAMVASVFSGAALQADIIEPTLRITSPLGRTGLPGTIRIVARLDGLIYPRFLAEPKPVPVRFFVDDVLLSSDEDGPPYEALWVDDNPFEPRRLTAEADLPTGGTLRTSIDLSPLEITDTAEISSVAVDATVVDSKGRFVNSLTAREFVLTEDGKPQALDLVSQSREPALFTLLVDSSQSMKIRSSAVRATAARLLAAIAADDQVVVAPFSRTVTTVTGPTTDRGTVLDAIAAIRHQGGTAILDSVGETATLLAGGTRRRAVVLITDGYDEHSESGFDAALVRLKTSGVTLYVVGVGGIAGVSYNGEALLKRLCEETGGHAWFPRDDQQLARAYEAIAGDVHQKYLLTYTPANQRRDGSWRSIDVTIPGTEYRVRARKGYTAPVAPPVRASLEFAGIGPGQVPLSLTRDDLAVVEDGVTQSIDVFQEAVLPVTFMLALDSSGSMKRSADQAREAAREFISAMRPEDRLGTILFSTKSSLIHVPSEKREYALEAVDRYVADGGTALYDALYDSLAQLATVEGRRAVVVVTDGRDENAASTGPGSLRTWEGVLQKLEQTEATVYVVGIGSRVDRARLEQLARKSGGAAYFPTTVSSLAADYHKILDEIRRRYIIGYESTNRSRDGKWRSVEIRTREKGVEIRSRGGYYAPPQ
jgi:Ca-activated chloride channel family protein